MTFNGGGTTGESAEGYRDNGMPAVAAARAASRCRSLLTNATTSVRHFKRPQRFGQLVRAGQELFGGLGYLRFPPRCRRKMRPLVTAQIVLDRRPPTDRRHVKGAPF